MHAIVLMVVVVAVLLGAWEIRQEYKAQELVAAEAPKLMRRLKLAQVDQQRDIEDVERALHHRGVQEAVVRLYATAKKERVGLDRVRVCLNSQAALKAFAWGLEKTGSLSLVTKRGRVVFLSSG